MEVKIDDKFYLLSDENNFILATKNKSGSFKHLAFFGRLEQALDKLIDKGLMQSTAKNLEELRAEIEKIRAEVTGGLAQILIKKIGGK